MDLWFELNDVRRMYHTQAVLLIESFVDTGASPFPRDHACYACDRDLRLMCIAWAGYGIDQVGPARNYVSQLYDRETGEVSEPETFMDSTAGRAGVWASRLIAAVGNGDLQLVSDLTNAHMPELDERAEALMIGVGTLTAERRMRNDLAAIERAVLAEMEPPPGQTRFITRFPPVPPPPPLPGSLFRHNWYME